MVHLQTKQPSGSGGRLINWLISLQRSYHGHASGCVYSRNADATGPHHVARGRSGGCEGGNTPTDLSRYTHRSSLAQVAFFFASLAVAHPAYCGHLVMRGPCALVARLCRCRAPRATYRARSRETATAAWTPRSTDVTERAADHTENTRQRCSAVQDRRRELVSAVAPLSSCHSTLFCQVIESHAVRGLHDVFVSDQFLESYWLLRTAALLLCKSPTSTEHILTRSFVP